MNGIALRLVLTQRQEATQKWPILLFLEFFSTAEYFTADSTEITAITVDEEWGSLTVPL